jgi:hypothetical protein
MAVTVKRITLWRHETDNRVGLLANILEPLVLAGADLQVVMGYRFPGAETKAAIEVYPISGRKAVAAAQQAGLTASSIPTLLVEGDNKPGLGHAIAQALADAGINLTFQVAQVLGRRVSVIYGFDTDADARRATSLIKKAAAKRR